MTQNPRNPNPIENEDLDSEAFESDNPMQNRDLADPESARNSAPRSQLAGDDPIDIEQAVTSLDEDDPDDLRSDLDEERIPDPTQQREFR